MFWQKAGAIQPFQFAVAAEAAAMDLFLLVLLVI